MNGSAIEYLDDPARVAIAPLRRVTIAPSVCECGRPLEWKTIEMRAAGGVPLGSWEHAYCRWCPLLWTTRRTPLLTEDPADV